MAKLVLMVGAPGSGKSTFLEKYAVDGQVISRDSIRFDILQDGDEYFAKETEVFDTFIYFIQSYLDRDINVYADATHLNEKSRKKVFDRLNLDGVRLEAIVFNHPLEVCLQRNAQRTGRSLVPEKALINMYNSYTDPINDSTYPFDAIFYVNG